MRSIASRITVLNEYTSNRGYKNVNPEVIVAKLATKKGELETCGFPARPARKYTFKDASSCFVYQDNGHVIHDQSRAALLGSQTPD